jgi:Ca2+-binding EF-hand superfamily protein
VYQSNHDRPGFFCVLALLGQHFDAAACQEMVKRADADKDGKIGFEDFAKMMKVSTKLRILVLEIVNS